MPRPRKPSKLLAREGAFNRNPKRKRTDLEGVGVLPASPPESLDLDRFEQKAWREIVSYIPPGIATGSERFVVELASRLLGRMRRTGDLKAADVAQLRGLLGSLALSVDARAKLGIPGDKPPAADGWEEFGAGAPPPPAVVDLAARRGKQP